MTLAARGPKHKKIKTQPGRCVEDFVKMMCTRVRCAFMARRKTTKGRGERETLVGAADDRQGSHTRE